MGIECSQGQRVCRQKQWISTIGLGVVIRKEFKTGSSYRKLHLEVGEGNGTPLQYSRLENPMDGGA